MYGYRYFDVDGTGDWIPAHYTRPPSWAGGPPSGTVLFSSYPPATTSSSSRQSRHHRHHPEVWMTRSGWPSSYLSGSAQHLHRYMPSHMLPPSYYVSARGLPYGAAEVPVETFRSSSAHLPVPPSTDYPWKSSAAGGPAARRTQSSAAYRVRKPERIDRQRRSPSPEAHYPDAVAARGILAASTGGNSSFANRFYNDRNAGEYGQPRDWPEEGHVARVHRRRSSRSPDDMPEAAAPSYRHPRHPSRAEGLKERQKQQRSAVTKVVDGDNEAEEEIHTDREAGVKRRSSHRRTYRQEAVEHRIRVGEDSDSDESESGGHSGGQSDAVYRVVSELLPKNTKKVHEAIIEATGKPELVLDADQLTSDHHEDSPSHHSHQEDIKNEDCCTCYQCHNNSRSELRKVSGQSRKTSGRSDGPGSRKPSANESTSRKSSSKSRYLVEDENCNLVSPGALVSAVSPYYSKSTAYARRHLQRANTSTRILTQAELLKLQRFRKFLRTSKLSQLDFLLRVEEVRRERDRDIGQEVDEEGIKVNKAGGPRDEHDQEFIALVAMMLCGDLEIRQDTFQAITSKSVVRDRLYKFVSADTDAVVTSEQVIEKVASTRLSGPKSELAGSNLRWLENVFKTTVGDHGEITLNNFKSIVQSKNPFFVERVFQIFDKDDSGAISFQEFIDAMHQFAGQTPDDKIKFLFKVYDIDGDGLIQEAELQHVMRACMDENGMNFDDESIQELTRALFQDATSGGQSGISFSSLKSQIAKHEGLMENLTISIDRWLVPPNRKKKFKLLKVFPQHQFSLAYLRNNAQLIIFYTLFFIVNVALFCSRLVSYNNSKNLDGSRNWATMVARACGQCLNLTCVVILLPMLRLSVTKLRQKGFNYLLPLDKHVSFHVHTAKLVTIYSITHTVAHIVNLVMNILVDPVAFLVLNQVPIPSHWISSNDSQWRPPYLTTTFPTSLVPPEDPRAPPTTQGPHLNSYQDLDWSIPKGYPAAKWIFTSTPGLFGLIPGWALPTGVGLCVVLLVIIICSMKWVRKSGNFEVFYWTHFLYLVFWVLCILHAPNFWKWLVGPFAIFVIEKCIRFFSLLSDKGKCYVSTGVVLPSRVVNLVIKRPANFTFKPGDYVYLNIPSIAQFEWHPFTISSAPEQTDTLSLHIRAVGHWTNSLYQYFEKEQARLEAGDSSLAASRARQRDNIIATARRKVSAVRGSSTLHLMESGGIPGSIAVWTGGRKVSSQSPSGRKRSSQSPSGGGCSRHINNNKTSEATTSSDEARPNKDTDVKMVARSFRYMRRKPTILSYIQPEAIPEEREEDLCSSNHFILDRIKEKGDIDNLYSAGDNEEEKEDSEYIKKVNTPLHVYIDGPFGAPTSQIFHAQHAVLIGTGIGVTPFASILQSIMHRYWAARNTCPKCSYSWTNDLSNAVMNLRKVDFFWINREQRSFEWFISLLSQLEIEQAEQGGAMERFLDMHMYITSALQKTDMKAVGLQLALELLHEKSKRDLITGLKTRTIAGRPNWDKVFRKLSEQKKGKITVYFCGPPQLGKILKLKCDQFGFEYKKENF